MSTLTGHFVSSPREREKTDRRESRGDETAGKGIKKKMDEREETRNKNISPLPIPAAKIAGLANISWTPL